MRTRSLLPYQLKVLGFDPEKDCHLREDNPDGTGGHVYIREWKSLEKQPTKEQLEAVSEQAKVLEAAEPAETERNAVAIEAVTRKPAILSP